MGTLPLAEVAAGKDALISQTRLVKLFTYINAVCDNVTTVEADSSERMPEGFLVAQSDANRCMYGVTWIVGIDQKCKAFLAGNDSFKSLFFCREQFNQHMP